MRTVVGCAVAVLLLVGMTACAGSVGADRGGRHRAAERCHDDGDIDRRSIDDCDVHLRFPNSCDVVAGQQFR